MISEFIGAEGFQLKPALAFIALCLACVAASVAGQMFFPGENLVPLVARSLLAAFGTIVLAIGSGKLLQDHFRGPEQLGLRLNVRSFLGFFGGFAGGFLMIALLAGAIWLIVPFHFERGELPLAKVVPLANGYFWSNLGEELVFRGVPLIILSRILGPSIALAVIALAFGLFHLPGLSGVMAAKMFLTTGASSYLFSAAFLATDTLWTAIGLHFALNVSLHLVTGLDGGTALLKPIFTESWPAYFDPGFLIFLSLPLLLASAIFYLRPPRLCLSATGSHLGN